MVGHPAAYCGKSALNFGYDATGQRTRKFVEDDQGALQSAQHYVRDAQGLSRIFGENIMAIYKYELDNGQAQLSVGDRSLYGSSRVGVDALEVGLSLDPNAYPAPEPTELLHVAGAKQYELTDHLGNVHVTISDQHLPIDDNADDEANWYKAQILSALDYYPFGMQMPGRTFNSGEYRFAFNGKEMDNEVSGNGNQYDYGFRIYNPRLGRFLSVDPLFKSYPWYTPYQFAGNKPIRFIDIDGLEEGEHGGNFNIWDWLFGPTAPDLSGVHSEDRESMIRLEDDQNKHSEAQIGLEKATDVIQTTSDGIEMAAGAPGADTFTDPALAAYYASQGDYATAAAYTAGIFIPAVSGAVVKEVAGPLIRGFIKVWNQELKY